MNMQQGCLPANYVANPNEEGKLTVLRSICPNIFSKGGGGCYNPLCIINIEDHITVNLLQVHIYGCPLSIDTKLNTIH